MVPDARRGVTRCAGGLVKGPAKIALHAGDKTAWGKQVIDLITRSCSTGRQAGYTVSEMARKKGPENARNQKLCLRLVLNHRSWIEADSSVEKLGLFLRYCSVAAR